MSFDTSFDRIFEHEGAFQNHPGDRGNWTSGQVGVGEKKGTRYGISAMSYPHLDIKNLTKYQAKEIYREEWWDKLPLDRPAIRYQLFDAAINHGMYHANRMVQRAVGAKDDGIIGPNTQASIQATELNDLLLRFLSERLTFMTQVRTWNYYGKGWARRIAGNLKLASEDN